jgi:hypothetical protein
MSSSATAFRFHSPLVWRPHGRRRAQVETSPPEIGDLLVTPTALQKHFKGWRDQLVADYEGQQLPMAHTSYVDVHEVRAAIVPDSSAMQAQGCVTQF